MLKKQLEKLNKQLKHNQKLFKKLQKDCEDVSNFTEKEVNDYFELLLKLNVKGRPICYFDFQRYLYDNVTDIEYHFEYISQEYGNGYREHVNDFLDHVLNKEKKFMYLLILNTFQRVLLKNIKLGLQMSHLSVLLLKRKQTMSKNKPPIKEAVCAFILDFDGKVLTVSRKNDPNDIGLPGGKVDLDSKGNPIESKEQALKREVLEETGFHINVSVPLYSAKEGKYQVTTYLAVIDTTKTYRPPSSKETGIVRMQPLSSLLTSTFKDYNVELLKILKLI